MTMEAWRHKLRYGTAMDLWMEYFGVEMTMANVAQIAEQERAFDKMWVSLGHEIPEMKRTLTQIYMNL
jgi:hypothetical protein